MVDNWPDIPFDESMLGDDVIIHCPEKDLVKELFDILAENGVGWAGGQPLSLTYWNYSGISTCYRVTKNLSMRYGDTHCYSRADYANSIKCTFYGVEPDIEISDVAFEEVISKG